ncbi:MAG: hypothetical protein ACPIOQ_81480, partial [Promethearchaeia archaeon]
RAAGLLAHICSPVSSDRFCGVERKMNGIRETRGRSEGIGGHAAAAAAVVAAAMLTVMRPRPRRSRSHSNSPTSPPPLKGNCGK